MTDQELSVRTLSRRAMDHALALTLPHAGEEERNALLATAFCADVVPAALGAGLSDAASLLRDPLVRRQLSAFIHSIVARMTGNQGSALLTEIEKYLNVVLPGFLAMPAGPQAGLPGDCAFPRPPRDRWRRVSPIGDVPVEATEAVGLFIMDDPEGLPADARYVPGSLRVREIGQGETRMVRLSARMRGTGDVEVERQSTVLNPATYSYRGTDGPLRARLLVTPEGFPCVELTQPLAPSREVQVAEEAPTATPPHPADLDETPAPRPDDADLARHVEEIARAVRIPHADGLAALISNG